MKQLLGLLLSLWLPADANANAEVLQAEQQRLVGVAQAQGLNLQVPAWVEDGAFVLVDIQLDQATPPLALSLLRLGEAEPRIARVTVAQWQAPLRLSTRIRLPKSQTLRVLARDGGGRSWQAEVAVQVLGSSCLTPLSANPLAGLGDWRVWQRATPAGYELVSLLRHPMESGQRRDQQGQLLPQRLLRSLALYAKGQPLLQIEAFAGLAANPYWRLLLPAEAMAVQLRWVDADGREQRQLAPANLRPERGAGGI
jgi:sulfur-oxidizing protein SoxZ